LRTTSKKIISFEVKNKVHPSPPAAKILAIRPWPDRCDIQHVGGRRRSCVARAFVSTASTSSCRCWCTWNGCARTCRSTWNCVTDSTSASSRTS